MFRRTPRSQIDQRPMPKGIITIRISPDTADIAVFAPQDPFECVQMRLPRPIRDPDQVPPFGDRNAGFHEVLGEY